ncbi:hypothetical protein GmHk_01G001759 [Glycine max]|nr:hypothetical protein GmHk_01G001759 [Glycine max]
MSLSLGKIIGRLVRVTLFCENAPTIWDQHRLQGTFKSSIFTPKAYTSKSPSGSLPPDFGLIQKTF